MLRKIEVSFLIAFDPSAQNTQVQKSEDSVDIKRETVSFLRRGYRFDTLIVRGSCEGPERHRLMLDLLRRYIKAGLP